MVIVLILAFVISTILYVAYYECLLCGNGSAGDRGCGDDHVALASWGTKRIQKNISPLQKKKGYGKESIKKICEDLHLFWFLI